MRMKQRFASMILALIMLCGCFGSVYAEESTDIEAFVTRFYVQILNRQPDQAGLAAWSDNLRSGREAGANVGYGFIQSEEFINRNLSNEDYIKTLYRAFFDREADESGLNGWLNELGSGLSRLHVYKGFAESTEFTELCARYGIARGNVALTAPMDQNENVTKFVARCYRLCLDRNADNEGLNAWCNQILSGANSAKEAAHGFVFSKEFQNKNLSNSDYVKILYRVFMDREADSSGLDAWVNVLNNGKSREHVFNGFADSVEFHKLCERYGIYAGEPTPEKPDESWKNIYAKAINDFIKINSNSGKFALFDIDRDGIPELILSTFGGGGSSNYGNDIYTIKDNKLFKMDLLPGLIQGNSKNGVRQIGYNANGLYGESIYMLDNNKFIEIGCITGILHDESENKYYLGSNYTDREEVSKEAFDNYMLERVGEPVGIQTVDLWNYENLTITVDNIDEYVTKY